jgi:hypothetical protein
MPSEIETRDSLAVREQCIISASAFNREKNLKQSPAAIIKHMPKAEEIPVPGNMGIMISNRRWTNHARLVVFVKLPGDEMPAN